MRASRRTFVRGVLGSGIGAAVMGFDPVQRSWISTAAAKGRRGGDIASIPGLDGALFTDADTRADYADDFGHIVSRMPIAVLQPGSISDIVKVLKFCHRHDIQVAARGQGHSTFGQAQVQGGLVIDMATLNQIESIGANHVTVQAGLRWRDLLEDIVPMGLMPPVLTGYVGLSIGGTLSMGGIGAASFRYGAQVDNVLELEVVTGEGELKTCSATRNPLLFNAVRGGVGQYGVIVRAKLPLIPAPPLTRTYVIGYPTFAELFANMEAMISANKVDGVYAQMVSNGAGGWVHVINAVKFFEPGSEPDDAHVLQGVQYAPGSLEVEDMPTLASLISVDLLFEFLDSMGLFHIPHVWSDAFLPGSKTEPFVSDTLAEVDPAEVGPAGFVLVFPVRNRFLDSVAFRLPRERMVYLFDVLASGLPSDPNFASEQVPKARALFERARRIGGTIYPIGSTPMSRSDWIRQYGAVYGLLSLAKAAYDPKRIMTPGPGIF